MSGCPCGRACTLGVYTANGRPPRGLRSERGGVYTQAMTVHAEQGHVLEVTEAEEEDMKEDPEMAMQGSSGNRKQLIICFLGIFVSYFVYGILQEKM